MARRVVEGDFWHSALHSMVLSMCSQLNAWPKILLAATVLTLAPTLILMARHSPSFISEGALKPIWEELPGSVLSGNLEYDEETQIVWQVPSSPKAVLFIAHGCHCRPTYFWDKGPNCTECVGLPEERVIVFHGITRRYAVIAISSARECWNFKSDKRKVLGILSSWIKRRGLERLPVVALGASSGGYFISAMAREYKFSSLVIMISEGVFHAKDIDGNYPPTFFVHMVKDKRRANLINTAMDLLKREGVPTAEAKCFPIPATPQFFTRIPGIDFKTAARVVHALRGSGIVDDQNLMTVDGRSMNWMMPLRNYQVMPEQTLRTLELHLQELLNLAYGYHEMTSAQSDKIFEWFDMHLSKSAT